MISQLLKTGKARILIGTLALVVLTTVADWATGDNMSLAALYILPMMLGAVVLRPWETAGFALLCSFLRSGFDIPGTPADLALRFVFAALAYFLSGSFVTALIRNHEQAAKHLALIQKEQGLRRDAEQQLRILAESSPAAIVTVDGEGVVLAANAAANKLFAAQSGVMLGHSIGDYVPSLADALRFSKDSKGMRTAAQCRGYRDNGEIFLAHMWFSSYNVPEGKRLAAIIVDSSEEMRDREELGLRHLLTGNRIATAVIAHEVRNIGEAMAMLCDDLRGRHGLTADEGLRGLEHLVGALEGIASLELNSKTHEAIEAVPLKEVLANLRIVIEPEWREMEASIYWQIPDKLPLVWAEPHGLLQTFLNLAQNSHRAVQDSANRRLTVRVSPELHKVILYFQDSGPGVREPERLFQPFQDGASGSGLGLYISRFIIRSYGGELRYEPRPEGTCFTIELSAVEDATKEYAGQND
ncbi:MAG: HAMP domain-containing sensor histidine kinase [Acidobacteriota bacterium]